MSRGGGKRWKHIALMGTSHGATAPKKISKKMKFPLDKPKNLCYNKDTNGEGKPLKPAE
jgi:hypothetical protein